jgi:hypothetical protein
VFPQHENQSINVISVSVLWDLTFERVEMPLTDIASLLSVKIKNMISAGDSRSECNRRHLSFSKSQKISYVQ